MNKIDLDTLDGWLNPRKDPPPNMVYVYVRGSDYLGDWYRTARRKDYKKPPKGKSPKGFRKGWRWVYGPKDERVDDFVEYWRPIDDET